MDVLVIYHGHCSDGWAGAWVARKAYPQATFYGANHGNPPPDVTDKEVYIIDFSYKRETLIEMHRKARKLIVLDHHKTAAKDLLGLDFCVFNMKKSGARLAWDYFSPKIKFYDDAPWLVDYVEDRDLWNWNLPHSREVNAALSSYEMDFHTWDMLDKLYQHSDLRSSWCPLIQDGAAIVRYQTRQIENIIDHSQEVMLDGYKVPAANTSVEFSDVAVRLAKNKPFGVAWYLREDGKYTYSLRSDENGLDVSEIATRHGGGGHRASSGFTSDKLLF